MKNPLNNTLAALVLLTLLGVFLTLIFGTLFSISIVLIFAVIKFLLVGFQFMELKKAHRIWKYLLVVYVLLISSIVFIILK